MLFRKVAENGLYMIGLEPVGTNLEDVFITLVNNSSDIEAKEEK